MIRFALALALALAAAVATAQTTDAPKPYGAGVAYTSRVVINAFRQHDYTHVSLESSSHSATVHLDVSEYASGNHTYYTASLVCPSTTRITVGGNVVTPELKTTASTFDLTVQAFPRLPKWEEEVSRCVLTVRTSRPNGPPASGHTSGPAVQLPVEIVYRIDKP